MSDKLLYENPLNTRYASREMLENFGDAKRFRLWRKLWIALAESEMELGLPVTQEQVDELKAHAEDIDFEKAEAYEREVRHDVMAHVKAYGDVAPKAKGIIHLGATSCFVDCNSEIMIMHDGEAQRFRLEIQGCADARIYASATRPAYDGGEARGSVASRPHARL